MPINELTLVVITLHETVVIVNPVVNVASGSKNITRLFNDHFTKSDDLPKPNILQSTSFLFKSASIEGMRCEQTHPDLTELKLYPTLPQLPVETLDYSGGWFVIHL
ncbi:hypothetical protein ACTFIR_003955 [Dictyostelium discoideum]